MEELRQDTTFDYIVVGGGTAGAIVARRLAENPLIRVCLIEAGPSDEGEEVVLRYGRWAELLKSPLDWDYGILPQRRANSRMRHSRAKVLGGCSSHNSVIAFLTPDSDLQRWAATAGPQWSPTACLPFLEKLQQKVNLVTVPKTNKLNAAFVAAAQEAGYREEVFNSKHFRELFGDSVGYLQLNILGEDRCSSSVAYLHPLDKLPNNLTVMTDCIVTRVLFDDDRNACGVATQSHGLIRARREVVLCAGAFDSPKLLLLSGVGPAWHLREMDIPIVANVPGVGGHLIDHPEGVLIWELTRPIPPPILQRYEAALFVTTDKNPRPSDGPDIMFHFGLEAFDMNTLPAGYPTHKNAISLTPNVTRAVSEGTVRLKSNDWRDPPVIDPAYFTDPEGQDEESMLASVHIARKIVSMPSLRPWIKRELAPGPDVKTDKELSEYLRTTNNTVYHPAGTCKMGSADDPLAVVGPDLRVRNVGRLRVADASIFPSMVSVNPCITIMMIAEKCASMLLQDGPIPSAL